jgi:2-keto-4-pentenoate hydratase/2-oxohepta-3-ene-1,7-dioic acid hydratase in catechol pathway
MKLLYFNDFRLGVLRGDRVVDVTPVVQNVPHTGPGNLINGVIERWSDLRGPIDKAASGSNVAASGLPVSQVKIRPPLPKPVNIDCMAVNYMEDGTRKEPAPINAFLKSPGCVVGHGDTVVLPDIALSIFEGEAELAVVIGKRAKQVPASRAMEHVFGYVNFIDGSARDATTLGNSFYQVKSRDTFAPMGPYLVTADEIKDPHKLQVRLWVNGSLKQNYNTDDMANRIPRCIEWISGIHDLEPGDLIATGTNHRGLSALQNGDTVELEIDGLGRLAVRVQDELNRTWARETRLEREHKGLKGYTPQLTGKYAKLSG